MKLRTAMAGMSVMLLGALGCSSSGPGAIIHPDTGVVGGGTGGGSGGVGTGGAGSGGVGTGGAGSGGVGTGGAGAGGTATGGQPADGGVDVPPPAADSAVAASVCTPSGNQFNCNNVLQGMDGYANLDPANGPSRGTDSLQFNCTNSEVVGMETIYKQQHWQLTGAGITTGRMYRVGLHFYGVVECKTYVGGTGPAKTDPNETPNVSQSHNLWLAGSRDNGDHWNTYAFTVTPNSLSSLVGIGPQNVPLPSTANTYVINQCPGTRPEGHFTFNLDFEASITVPGGSWINYIEYDTNCLMISNCGAAESNQTCAGPYNVVNTVTNVVPNTNATFSQPLANTSNPPSRGQWWLVDVTGVTEM
jgi:hypothetical protein